jgi:hypothetical protein
MDTLQVVVEEEHKDLQMIQDQEELVEEDLVVRLIQMVHKELPILVVVAVEAVDQLYLHPMVPEEMVDKEL